jgi:tetratricopeptide (TPR) repeat protein
VRASIFLLLVVSGCGHFPFRPSLMCPVKSGPTWHEYGSAHFVVTSDLRTREAHSLVEELERTYRSYLDIAGWHFPDRGEPPGRMRLVVFERDLDYSEIGPRGSDAFFAENTVDGEPIVVMSMGDSYGHSWRELFLHELTHRMLRYYVAKAPRWLHEGLAEFYSTFALDHGEAFLGRPPKRARMMQEIPTLKAMFEFEQKGSAPVTANAFYVGSWLAVHVIARGFQRQLGGALVRMADGEDANQALAESFGPEGLAALDKKYREQAREGAATIISWHVAYQPAPAGGVQAERPLDDRDVHLLWASLQGPLAKGYLAQVELAEKHQGVCARSQFMRGINHAARAQLTPAEREISAAVDARPDEERYRWALAQLHFDDALERHLGDDKLDALDPDMQWLRQHGRLRDSFILTASYAKHRGQLADARSDIERALAIDATSASAWDTLSAIAFAQGDIDGAFDAADRALHIAPDGKEMKETSQRLDKLRALRLKREQRMKSGD